MRTRQQKKLWADEQWPLDETAGQRYHAIMKTMDTAARMTERGVRVDAARCNWHIEQAQERGARFTADFLRITGMPASSMGDKGMGGTKAVRDWFWVDQGAPQEVRDKITKKPQFNSACLIGYATGHKGKAFADAAAALYGIRKAKVSEKFAKAYLAVSTQYNGRIHFGFNVTGTKGERWSASAKFRWYDQVAQTWVKYRLNAQNVPSKEPRYKGEKLTLSLRDCFIPDRGKVWLKFDGDQAEARCLAYTTGAATMLDWIHNGQDLHIEMAKRLFLEAKIPADWTDKDDPRYKKTFGKYRDGNKAMMYAFAYCFPNDKGETFVEEVHKQLLAIFPDLTLEDVQLYCKRYFGVLPEFRAWQNATIAQVRATNKFVLPQNGRFLWLPASMRGYNMSGNFQMQSGYGYLINRALPEIDRIIAPFDAQLLIQLHDEADLQAWERDAYELEVLVGQELSRPANFGGRVEGIPHAGDMGYNWKELVGRENFYGPFNI